MHGFLNGSLLVARVQFPSGQLFLFFYFFFNLDIVKVMTVFSFRLKSFNFLKISNRVYTRSALLSLPSDHKNVITHAHECRLLIASCFFVVSVSVFFCLFFFFRIRLVTRLARSFL